MIIQDGTVRMTRVRDRGFTLVEVIVVSLLVLVVVGGLLTTYLVGQTSFFSAEAATVIQQQARQAFDNVVRELRESTTVSCGTAGTTTTCTSRRLNFQVVQGYAGGSPVLGDGTTTDRFAHFIITGTGADEQLVRCDGSTAPTVAITDFSGCRVLANHVDGATSDLRWDNVARIVTLNLEIEYAHSILPTGSQTTGVLTSQVKLRNPSS